MKLVVATVTTPDCTAMLCEACSMIFAPARLPGFGAPVLSFRGSISFLDVVRSDWQRQT